MHKYKNVRMNNQALGLERSESVPKLVFIRIF